MWSYFSPNQKMMNMTRQKNNSCLLSFIVAINNNIQWVDLVSFHAGVWGITGVPIRGWLGINVRCRLGILEVISEADVCGGCSCTRCFALSGKIKQQSFSCSFYCLSSLPPSSWHPVRRQIVHVCVNRLKAKTVSALWSPHSLPHTHWDF